MIYYFAISRYDVERSFRYRLFRTEVLKSHFNSIRRSTAPYVRGEIPKKGRSKRHGGKQQQGCPLQRRDARREIHRRKEDETTRIKAEILGTNPTKSPYAPSITSATLYGTSS